MCKKVPSVHQTSQVDNLHPPPPETTALGRRKPVPVVSTAPQHEPTRPSPVGTKKSDVSEEMDAQCSRLNRKDPPPDSSALTIASINSQEFHPHCKLYVFDHTRNFDLCFVPENFVARPDAIKHLSTHWPGSSFGPLQSVSRVVMLFSSLSIFKTF